MEKSCKILGMQAQINKFLLIQGLQILENFQKSATKESMEVPR